MRPDKAINDRKASKKAKQREACEEARQCADRATEKEAKAVERLESGDGNPVDLILFERQKEILANQKAIMAELGIE